MSERVIHNRDAIHAVLRATSVNRDSLPYSEEFDRHLTEYQRSAGVAVNRQEFWRALSNAAKNGGWEGKKRGEPPPPLTSQQADTLRGMLAGRLGSRDRLPYSPEFDALRDKFNRETGLALAEGPFWRAVCGMCKHPLRPDVDRLLAQAVDSLTIAVDHFNRSSDQGRPATVLMLLDHAWEMLLKAGLLQRGIDIRDAGTGFTLTFETCLNRATTGEEQFLSGDERLALRVLNALRDQAQHFLVEVTEQTLYAVAQSALTLFAKLTARLFGLALAERLPRRVMPLSTDPPESIHLLMDGEFSQLQKLLGKGAGKAVSGEAKLRCLLAMDRAITDQPNQVAGAEFEEATRSVAAAPAWDEVFKGIARLQMTPDGSGIRLALTIQKDEGIPVRVVKEGEEATATIAVRKVNNTDFYCFGARELARRIKLDQHKTLALIWKLGLQGEDDCYRVISIGKSKHKMYSQNALARLRSALPSLDLEAVCKEYATEQARRRSC